MLLDEPTVGVDPQSRERIYEMLAERKGGGAALGSVQMSVMFVWGALVFGLPLASHLVGFALVTVVTAAFLAITRLLARRWETV